MWELASFILLEHGDVAFVVGVLVWALVTDLRDRKTLTVALGLAILLSTACTIDEIFPDSPRRNPTYYGYPPAGSDPYAPPSGPVTQPWMGSDGRMSLCTTIPSNPPTTFCYGQGTLRGLPGEYGYGH